MMFRRLKRSGPQPRGLKRFWRDARGAIAVQFALLALPLSVLAFGLYDVNRASVAKEQLQDALDAATLLAARSNGTTNAALYAVGNPALTQNMSNLTGVTLTSSSFTINGGYIDSTATATITPIISNLWQSGNVTIGASSEVVKTMNNIELALVLDNTGSMSQDGKLPAMQAAANNLIDTLSTAAAQSGKPNAVKIGLVPFAMTVRVNPSTYGTATWVDQTGASPINNQIFTKSSGTYSANRFTLLRQMGVSWAGCLEERQAPYDVQDTPPTTATPATLFTPYFWPDEPDPQASGKNGNFGTFDNNYLTDGSYSSSNWLIPQGVIAKYTKAPKSGTDSNTGYAYGPNSGCTMQEVMRLTTNFSSIQSEINAMVAGGDTNIPMGLIWGWHVLSPNAPFADGVSYSTATTTKVVVLMTDGYNTYTTWSNNNTSLYEAYGYLWQGRFGITSGTDAQREAALDARQTLLCNNMKADGIVIYTVRVEYTNDPSTALQNCASDPTKYYAVANASGLTAAFNSIAGSILNLRISK